jgi:hypothetical protein
MTKVNTITLTEDQLEAIYLALIHRQSAIEDTIARNRFNVDSYWASQKENTRETLSLIALAYENMMDVDKWVKEHGNPAGRDTADLEDGLLMAFLTSVQDLYQGRIATLEEFDATLAMYFRVREAVRDWLDN